MDSLGDRIKGYEDVTRRRLMRRVPVMIRVDGRAFHTFTRRMEKPFDKRLQDAMVYAAKKTASEMSGFKVGYIQSDEASFVLTDYDTNETQPWFDYVTPKLVSISSALMSVHFAHYMTTAGYVFAKDIPVFDARAFNVPREDVANALLWRAKDWERNSLTMYASTFFSHKQLHGKSKQDRHDMLHSVGKNWATDVDERSKNGTFFDAAGVMHYRPATYEEVSKLIHPLVHPDRDPSEYDELRRVYDLSKLKRVPTPPTSAPSNAELNSGWKQGSSGPDAQGWRS